MAAEIPLELSTFCDTPVGSGLGASSTFGLVIIRAFVELINLIRDDYTIAQPTFKIKRIDSGCRETDKSSIQIDPIPIC